MKYNVGQKVIFTDLNGREHNAEIYLRKTDYPNEFINEVNHKGGFDYVVKFELNKTTFCQAEDLSLPID